MPDDTAKLRYHIRMVALRVVAEHLRSHVGAEFIYDAWDSHEDIGEHDWDRVVEDVARLADLNDVTDAHYDAAVEFLKARAER